MPSSRKSHRLRRPSKKIRRRRMLLEALEARQLLTTGAVVMDDGDSGYQESGAWYDNFDGYQGDSRTADAYYGASSASWDFSVTPGDYKVSAHWVPQFDSTDAASFDIAGSPVDVDQTQAPNDFQDSGVFWEDLATVTVSGTSLLVTLDDDGSGFGAAVADAIRIEPVGGGGGDLPGNDTLDSADHIRLHAGVPVTIAESVGNDEFLASDIDLYRVELVAGQVLNADVDALSTEFQSTISSLHGRIRLFDAAGVEIASSFEQAQLDPALEFTALSAGVYYVGISSHENGAYDPTDTAGRPANGTLGNYQLHLVASDVEAAGFDNTIQVTTTVDSTDPNDGQVSLREAVASAQALSGRTLVEFSVGETNRELKLVNGPISVGSDLTIRGPAAGEMLRIVPDAQAIHGELLSVQVGASLALEDIALEGAFGTGNGSALHVEGSARLQRSEIRNSSSTMGGAVYVAGQGEVILLDSSLIANSASQGGAVFVEAGGAFVASTSTISGNDSSSLAAAIENHGETSLYASTVAANGSLGTTVSATISNAANGKLILRNTIVSDNSTIADLDGAFDSHGFNVIGNIGSSTGIGGVGHMHDQFGVPAAPIVDVVGPLYYQGGRTGTHILKPNSPAMDAGSSFGRRSTDQRGAPRFLDGLDLLDAADTRSQLDVGATEFGSYFVNSNDDAVDASVVGDGQVDVDLSATGVQVSVRAAVQELSELAGWNGGDNPQLNAFEGYILFSPAASQATLTLNGPNEDGSLSGDLDVFGNLTVRGNNTDYTDETTSLWGDWTIFQTNGDPTSSFDDRLFHMHEGASLAIQNIWLGGGSATGLEDDQGRGGMILNDAGGNLAIQDAKLGDFDIIMVDPNNLSPATSHSAAEGGVIFTRDGTTEIVRSQIVGGDGFSGGAIYLESGELSVEGSLIDRNRARDEGGAIFVGAGSLHVTAESQFNTNEVWESGAGGAIFVSESGNAVIEGGSQFVDNHGYSIKAFSENDPETIQGNGIFNAGNLTVRDGVRFEGQSAQVLPGESVFYTEVGNVLHNTGIAVLDDVELEGNFSSQNGALYNAPKATISVTNATLNDSNSAPLLVNDNGYALVERSLIGTHEVSDQNGNIGAGIHNVGINADMTVIGSTINRSGHIREPGIYNFSGDLDVINTTFYRNWQEGIVSGDAPAIQHLGLNRSISEETTSLVTLQAEVDPQQDVLFLDDVAPLMKFPVPFYLQVGHEKMTVVEIDEFRDALIVDRKFPENHVVSTPVTPFVSDRQTKIVIGDPEEFAKYQVPFDLILNDEVLTVIEMDEHLLTVERGRNGTFADNHLYPFKTWALSGTTTISNSSFAGNFDGPMLDPIAGESVFALVNPFARAVVIENSTFTADTPNANVGHVRTGHFAEEAWLTGSNLAGDDPDPWEDFAEFPVEEYANQPAVYIENSVFAKGRHVLPSNTPSVDPLQAVNGQIISGGGNFVEAANTVSLGLGTPLNLVATELEIPSGAKVPEVPFSMQIGRIVDDQWQRESVIVTDVAPGNEPGSIKLTFERGANGTSALSHPVGSSIIWSENGFWHPTDIIGMSNHNNAVLRRVGIAESAGIPKAQTIIKVDNPGVLLPTPFFARITHESGSGKASESIEVLSTSLTNPDLNDYEIEIERSGDALDHPADSLLEFFYLIDSDLDAQLDGISSAQVGNVHSHVNSSLPFPQPGSPLLDTAIAENFTGYTTSITSNLPSEYRLEGALQFSIDPNSGPVTLAVDVLDSDSTIELSDVSSLPANPFYLRIHNEILKVNSVDAIANTVSVDRGYAETSASSFSAGENVMYGSPVSSSATDSLLLVDDVTKFPEAPFYLATGVEIMRVDAVNRDDNTINVIRGYFGTDSTAHPVGVTLRDSLPDASGSRVNFHALGTSSLERVDSHLDLESIDEITPAQSMIPMNGSAGSFLHDMEQLFAESWWPESDYLDFTMQIEEEQVRILDFHDSPVEHQFFIEVERYGDPADRDPYPAGSRITFSGESFVTDSQLSDPAASAGKRVRVGDRIFTAMHDLRPHDAHLQPNWQAQAYTLRASFAADVDKSHVIVPHELQLELGKERTKQLLGVAGAWGTNIEQVTGSQINLNISSTLGLPELPFLMRLGGERLTVTAVDEDYENITVTRAVNGTAAQDHGFDARPASGVFATVADASAFTNEAPFTISIGGESMLVTDVNENYNLIRLQRAYANGSPTAHAVGQDLLFGNETMRSGHSSVSTILSSALDASATQVTLSVPFELPEQFELRVHQETMRVTNAQLNGNGDYDLTLVRGVSGTTAAAHLGGSIVRLLMTEHQQFRFVDSSASGSKQIDRGAVEAQIFNVNSTQDLSDSNPGDGLVTTSVANEASLRAAIEEANALSGPTTVVVPSGNYHLLSPILVSSHVHLIGEDAGQTTITASSSRAFEVSSSGSLRMTNVTVDGALSGGGISVDQGVLTLDRSVISNSSAVHGAAIENNQGTIEVFSSTLHSNASSGNGGGIRSLGGLVELRSATLSGNSAVNGGGGIFADSDTELRVHSSTIAANSTTSGAGGIESDGVKVISNTLIATNTTSAGDPDVSGHYQSLGGNLVGVLEDSSYHLTADVNPSDTAIAMNSMADLPAIPFQIKINDEVIVVTGTTSTHLIVSRATNAEFHSSGSLVRMDGFVADRDQTGSPFSPIDAKITPLDLQSSIPVHGLMPDSPAVDGGNAAALEGPQIFAADWSSWSGNHVVISNWETLPAAPFQIKLGDEIRTVMSRQGAEIVLDAPLSADRATAVTVLSDQRGMPKGHLEPESNSEGGSGGGGSGGGEGEYGGGGPGGGGGDPGDPVEGDDTPFVGSVPDIGAFELVPIVSVLENSITQIESGVGTITYSFTVERSGLLNRPLTVAYQVVGTGDYHINAADFVNDRVPEGKIEFAADETSMQIDVEVRVDDMLEPDEQFEFRLLRGPFIGILNDRALATIENDDSVQVNISSPSVDEGRAMMFDVTLQGTAQEPLWVTWETDESTAASDDFRAGTGMIKLDAENGFSTEIVIPTEEDDTIESDESLDVNLTYYSPHYFDNFVTVSNGVGTILNDDFSSSGFVAAFDVSNEISTEDASQQDFTITLLGNAAQPFTVSASTLELSAKDLTHFDAVSEQLSFDGYDGETKTVSVPLIHDGEHTFDAPIYELLLSDAEVNGIPDSTIDVSAAGMGEIENVDSGWGYMLAGASCAPEYSNGYSGYSGVGGSGILVDWLHETAPGEIVALYEYTGDDFDIRGHGTLVTPMPQPRPTFPSSFSGASYLSDNPGNHTCDEEEEVDVQTPDADEFPKIKADWVVPYTEILTFNPFPTFDYHLTDEVEVRLRVDGNFLPANGSVDLEFGSVVVNPDSTLTYTPNGSIDGMLPEVDANGNVYRYTGIEKFNAHIVNKFNEQGVPPAQPTSFESVPLEIAVADHFPTLRGDHRHEPDPTTGRFYLDGPIYADVETSYRIDLRDIFSDLDGVADLDNLSIREVVYGSRQLDEDDSETTTINEDPDADPLEFREPIGVRDYFVLPIERDLIVRKVGDSALEIENEILASDLTAFNYDDAGYPTQMELVVKFTDGNPDLTRPKKDNNGQKTGEYELNEWELSLDVRPHNKKDQVNWHIDTTAPEVDSRPWVTEVSPGLSTRYPNAVGADDEPALNPNPWRIVSAQAELSQNSTLVAGTEVDLFDGDFRRHHRLLLDASGGTSELALPGLIYDSSTVHLDGSDMPVIRAELSGDGTATGINATLTWHNESGTSTTSWTASSPGDLEQLIAISPNQIDKRTGLYKWLLEVDIDTPNGQSTLTTGGETAVVYGEHMAMFGAGWALNGVPTLNVDHRSEISNSDPINAVDDRIILAFPGQKPKVFSAVDLRLYNYSFDGELPTIQIGSSTVGSDGFDNPTEFGTLRARQNPDELVYNDGSGREYVFKKHITTDGTIRYLIDRIEQAGVEFDRSSGAWPAGRRGVSFEWDAQGVSGHPILETIIASDGARTKLDHAGGYLSSMTLVDASDNPILKNGDPANQVQFDVQTTSIDGVTVGELKSVRHQFGGPDNDPLRTFTYQNGVMETDQWWNDDPSDSNNLVRHTEFSYAGGLNEIQLGSGANGGNKIVYTIAPASDSLKGEVYTTIVDLQSFNESTDQANAINAGTVKTEYTYSIDGRLTQREEFFDNQSTSKATWSYDHIGFVKRSKDALGREAFYWHDYEEGLDHSDDDDASTDDAPKYDPDDYRGNLTYQFDSTGFSKFEYETDDEAGSAVGRLMKSVFQAQVNASGQPLDDATELEATTLYKRFDDGRVSLRRTLRKTNDTKETSVGLGEDDLVQQWTYDDGSGYLETYTDARGLVSTYGYTGSLITSTVATDGQTTQTDVVYDVLGFVDKSSLTVAGTKLSETDFDFDSLGRLSRQQSSNGTNGILGISEFSYAADGVLISSMTPDPNDIAHDVYTYSKIDDAGLLTESRTGLRDDPTQNSSPASATYYSLYTGTHVNVSTHTQFEYYANGALKKTTFDDGTVEERFFDPAAKLSWTRVNGISEGFHLGGRESNNKFKTVRSSFDDFGRLNTHTDLTNNTNVKTTHSGPSDIHPSVATAPEDAIEWKSKHQFDSLGRTKFVEQGKSLFQFNYDALGYVNESRDVPANRIATTTTTNAAGDILESREARTKKDGYGDLTWYFYTSYEYDQYGRVTKVVDPQSDGWGDGPWADDEGAKPAKTTYGVDDGLLKVTSTDRAGISTHSWVDAMGRTIKQEDADGSTTEHIYDVAGMLTTTVYQPVVGQDLTVGYKYDSLGRLRLTTHESTDADFKSFFQASDYFRNGEAGADQWNEVHFIPLEVNGTLDLTNPSTFKLPLDPTRTLLPPAPIDLTDLKYVSARSRYDSEGKPFYIQQPDPSPSGDDTPTSLISYVHNSTTGETTTTTTTSTAHNADSQFAGLDWFRIDRRTHEKIANKFGQITETRARISDAEPFETLSQATYYADTGLLKTETDANNNTTHYEYDHRGNLIKVTDAKGEDVLSEYDSAGNVTSRTDQRGNKTKFRYDGLGRLIRVTDALGNSTSTKFEDGGRTSRVSSQLRADVVTTVDPVMRTKTVDHGLGIVATTEFDSYGNEIKSTNTSGHGPERTFDALGRLVQSSLISGQNSIYEYDVRGNLISEIDPRGNQTRHEYDLMNRRTKTIDAKGTQSRFTYDAFGNITLAKVYDSASSLLSKTFYQYDSLGREIEATQYPDVNSSNGLTTQTTYDRVGNVKSVIDPLGNETKYDYDELNRLTHVHDALAGTVAYTYDEAGNRLTLTDPEQNTTIWEYDELNRVKLEKNELEKERKYEYDSAGSLFRFTDRNGRITEYVYDNAGRKTGELWFDQTGTQVHTITTAIDSSNRITSVTDAHATVSYGAYDGADRPTLIHTDILGLSPTYSVEQGFDAAGNRSFVEVDAGTVDGFRNDYLYDALNRLDEISQTGSNANHKRIDYSYDALSRLENVQRYQAMTNLVVTETYDFDDMGRLLEIEYTHASAADLPKYEWDYDNAGRIIELKSPDRTVTYGYDETNQLTSEITYDEMGEAVSIVSYDYDANGNRESVTVDGVTTTYTPGQNNQTDSDGRYSYTYDDEGNRKTRTDSSTGNITEYIWDHRNRLEQVTEKDVAGDITQIVAYRYDPLNRRVAKSVTTYTPLGSPTTETTYYVSEGDRAARDGAGDQVVLQLDGSGNITNRYLHGAAIDEVLADENGAGDVLWPLADNVGSIRDLLSHDESAGTTTNDNHIVYDGFGNVVSETDDAIDHLFGYTGREFDDEVDLQYNRARYYDSSLGQWLSQDPIGFDAGDSNLRRYVGNHGTSSNDPSGLDEIEIQRSSAGNSDFLGSVEQWSDWWHGRGRVVWHGQDDWVIGEKRGDWIYFVNGGRATFTALKKHAAAIQNASHVAMQDIIAGIKSPYRINGDSNEIGIFLGGTNQHIHDIGNVERMYNIFTGTKFYHGGIGHPVDYEQESISGANGWGFQAGIDRALADVLDHYQSGKKISIYGWSRGAAQSIELARELEKLNIPVEFIGLFDPVYSVVSAGHGSRYITPSDKGIIGNYVEITAPKNVRVATAIYAMNEDRSWFPATWLHGNGRTTINLIGSPGAHGEVGGHWESSMEIQQLNLRAMIEFARGQGGVRFGFTGIDSEIEGILRSEHGRRIALRNYLETPNYDQKLKDWIEAISFEHWSPLTEREFREQLNSTKREHWTPGGFGTQNWDLVNAVWVLSQIGSHPLPNLPSAGEVVTGTQPVKDHYPRKLPWVRRGLWDVYENENASRGFIESLYKRRIDPRKGGWK